MNDVLARIEAVKVIEREVLGRALRTGTVPEGVFVPSPAVLEEAVALLERGGAPPTGRSLAEALSGQGLAVVAEVKRRSPSAGAFARWTDPEPLAAAYAAGGAAALSVLTDVSFFDGRPAFLSRCRPAFAGPILRKDFLRTEVDLALSRALGADAVLGIVALLGRGSASFVAAAARYGLEVLLELHDAEELEIALDSGARILGVNNRDLDTFTTDLGTTERLAARVPGDRILVSESGIRGADDALRMRRAGADAILVGEALARGGGEGLAALRVGEGRGSRWERSK